MKIALLGYGKMGKAIEDYCLTNTQHEIVLKIDDHTQHLLTDDQLLLADVAIDFSSPEVAVKHISACIGARLPVVSGTTGWLEQWDTIIESVNQNNGSFFYASNYSIGVNLFWQIIEKASELIKEFDDYDSMIEETHHIHKLDAPSGTAITTAEKMMSQLTKYNTCDNITIEHKANSRMGFVVGAVKAAEFLVDKTGVFGMNDLLNNK